MHPKHFAALMLMTAIVAVLVVLGPAVLAHEIDFRAELFGEEEVVDGATGVIDTEAEGDFRLRGRSGDAALTFELKVEDVENILQAHIHLGPKGENGPIVVWLRPEGPPPVLIPGEFDGVLAEGTITADDVVGPLEGMTLDDLLAAMEAGNAYVNVHTSQHPGGEIRGQIE